MCPTSSPWKLREGTCSRATLFLQAMAHTSESAPQAEMLAQYQLGEEGSIVHRACGSAATVACSSAAGGSGATADCISACLPLACRGASNKGLPCELSGRRSGGL